MKHFVLTESGRLIARDGSKFVEFKDGAWGPISPGTITLGDIMDGRPLSEEEVRSYIERSGKPV